MKLMLKNPSSFSDEFMHDLRRIARYDHSVSVPELGSLFRHDAGTPILESALARIAEIYGVRRAYPSTNGTTSLNAIAMHSQCYPDSSVLVQRDSHVSIFGVFNQIPARPHYLVPPYSLTRGVPLGITPETLVTELDAHPDVDFVVLTYPNYFGIATDIKTLAEICHQRGKRLMVDEAHGSHLQFHTQLPHPAENTSAAIITQSTHKTCSALSQGSLALINDVEVLKRWYEIVNTSGHVSTSFSFPVLASIIAAVQLLDDQGEELLGRAISAAQWLRDAINHIEPYCCFGFERPEPGFVAFDPLRVTVDVSGLGMTGFEVEEYLIREHHLYPEMATLQNVLFLVTLADSQPHVKVIADKLATLAQARPVERARPATLYQPGLPKQLMLPYAVHFSRHRKSVSVSDAIGYPSAETISAYPPGTAIVVSGEEITEEVIEYLSAIRDAGGVLKGASDPGFATVTIVTG